MLRVASPLTDGSVPIVCWCYHGQVEPGQGLEPRPVYGPAMFPQLQRLPVYALAPTPAPGSLTQ